MGDELMTVSEVAEQLRVPIDTLRYWRHVGRGPQPFKIGKHLRYRRGDVEAWIETQYQAAQSAPSQ